MLAPIDIAVLILMGITAAIGFWTGFVWQVIRIISVMASIWAALVYQSVMASFLAGRVPLSYRAFVCTLGVFAVAMVVLFLVGYLFREVVNALKPQMTDRVLGAGFGLVLGALLGAFFAFTVIEFTEEDGKLHAAVDGSITAMMGRFLGHALPDSLRRAVDEPGAVEGAPALPTTRHAPAGAAATPGAEEAPPAQLQAAPAEPEAAPAEPEAAPADAGVAPSEAEAEAASGEGT